jgi:hypothetical protein
VAGRSESPAVSRGRRQLVGPVENGARDGREHELRDPVAALECHRLGTEIRDDDPDLSAIVAVDRPGAFRSTSPLSSASPLRIRS